MNELDKCFFEPVSIIVVTPGKRKRKQKYIEMKKKFGHYICSE